MAGSWVAGVFHGLKTASVRERAGWIVGLGFRGVIEFKGFSISIHSEGGRAGGFEFKAEKCATAGWFRHLKRPISFNTSSHESEVLNALGAESVAL